MKKIENLILAELGERFFTIYNRQKSDSAERLFQASRVVRLFRDIFTFVFSGGIVMALARQEYAIALLFVCALTFVLSPYYWQISGVGRANAACIDAWMSVRRKIRRLSCFKKLCLDTSLTRNPKLENFNRTFHYQECIRCIDETSVPGSKKLSLADLATE